MKEYQKPTIEVTDEVCEGVYAASGEKERCRFGRKFANPHSQGCRACYATGGVSNQHTFCKEFGGCVDNMPVKDNDKE